MQVKAAVEAMGRAGPGTAKPAAHFAGSQVRLLCTSGRTLQS
jgi:hypothetical protein